MSLNANASNANPRICRLSSFNSCNISLICFRKSGRKSALTCFSNCLKIGMIISLLSLSVGATRKGFAPLPGNFVPLSKEMYYAGICMGREDGARKNSEGRD